MTIAGILALVIGWVVCCLPAVAANSTKKITVEQLDRMLSAPDLPQDAEFAQQLSGLELTDRLSPETLARLKTKSPRSQCSQVYIPSPPR